MRHWFLLQDFVCLFIHVNFICTPPRSLYRKTSWHVLAEATAAVMQNTCLKIYRSSLDVWDTERCVLFLPGGPSLFEYKAAYATRWLPQSLFHLHANYCLSLIFSWQCGHPHAKHKSNFLSQLWQLHKPGKIPYIQEAQSSADSELRVHMKQTVNPNCDLGNLKMGGGGGGGECVCVGGFWGMWKKKQSSKNFF